MAKNFDHVQIIKSKDGNGLIFVEKVGVETPLNPNEELPSTSRSAGAFSSEGLTITEENDGGESILDSDGDIIKNTPGTTSSTISFDVLETGTPAAMALVYHEDDITEEDGVVTGYDQTDKVPGPFKFIMEFQTDTGKIGRRTFFNCVFQSRGEEVVNVDNPNSRRVTYAILKDPASTRRTATRVMDRPAGVPAV